MTIHVEVRNVAMQSLALQIGHVAKRQNVVAPVHRHAVLEAKTFPRFYLFENRPEFAVLNGWLSDVFKRKSRNHGK